MSLFFTVEIFSREWDLELWQKSSCGKKEQFALWKAINAKCRIITTRKITNENETIITEKWKLQYWDKENYIFFFTDEKLIIIQGFKNA